MRNKILVVQRDAQARNQLDNILQEIVEEGGELILVDNPNEGLAILQKEKPQVLFLDATLIDDQAVWIQKDTHLILTLTKGMESGSQDYVLMPFKRHQVLEKCWKYLSSETAFPIPPM